MSAVGPTFPAEPPPAFEGRSLKDYGGLDLVLGQGQTSRVFKTTTGYVIKILRLEVELTAAQLNEIAYPVTLHHPHVVKYYDIYLDYPRHAIYLIMDPYNGNLEILCQRIRLSRDQYLALTKQMVSALAYLDSRNVLHRDVKPSNILYRDGANFVLADFSRAIGHECLLNSLPGPAYGGIYTPPEVILGRPKYTGKADIWALGVTLYYAYPGRRYSGSTGPEALFKASNNAELKASIRARLAVPEPRIVPDPKFNALLTAMLQINPAKRATAFEIEHQFLRLHDPDIRCPDRVELFDRHPSYQVMPSNQTFVTDQIIRLMDGQRLVARKLEAPLNYAVHALAVELFYRFLTLNPEFQTTDHTDTRRQQFLLTAALYLAYKFLTDYSLTMRQVSEMVDLGSYSQSAMQTAIVLLLPGLDFDLAFTTSNDKLKIYPGTPEQIALAEELLWVFSPFPAVYFYPDLPRRCLDIASKPAGLYVPTLDPLYRQIHTIRLAYRDYFAILSPRVREVISTEWAGSPAVGQSSSQALQSATRGGRRRLPRESTIILDE